jgi:hypothetical protein
VGAQERHLYITRQLAGYVYIYIYIYIYGNSQLICLEGSVRFLDSNEGFAKGHLMMFYSRRVCTLLFYLLLDYTPASICDGVYHIQYSQPELFIYVCI